MTLRKSGYCKLQDEALDRTLWRTCFGQGYEHVIRQTINWMNIKGQHKRSYTLWLHQYL